MNIRAITRVRLAGQQQPLEQPLELAISVPDSGALTAGDVLGALAAQACGAESATARAIQQLLPATDRAPGDLIAPDQFWLFINGKPYTSRRWPVSPWRRIDVLLVALQPLVSL